MKILSCNSWKKNFSQRLAFQAKQLNACKPLWINNLMRKKIKDSELREAILKIVGILGNLSLFMQQSDNNAKNILLGLLISDCIMKDKRLTYTIRKPFSYLLACPDHIKWQGLIIKYLKDFKNMVLLIQKM